MPHLFLADYGLFIGRFHPILVHLPIGILLLAVLLEWWPGDKLRPAIRVAWVVGALAAVTAAGAGWLLAAESSGGDTLFWHRWLGVGVAVLAVAGVWITRPGGSSAKGYGILTVLLLSVTGHQGGNLTHGEAYLVEHAPVALQTIAGYDGNAKNHRDWSKVNTDSINLYAGFLQPALATSCTRCHNAEKQNGGLRLDHPHAVYAGGEGGSIIAPGNPLESEWFRRVTLPQDNAKSMPPSGEGWDYTTIKLLEYWIASGADTLMRLSPTETPPEIKTLLLRDYNLELRTKLFVETVTAPALAPEKRAALQDLNWSISNLNPKGSSLAIKVSAGEQLAAGALEQLVAMAQEQVCYLDLGKLPLQDADLTPLAGLPNLNRLRLNGTELTEATVARLKSLPHLESLNLYGTSVGDAIFEHLQDYPALKRLYLWQTQVSPEAAAAFAKANPHLLVDTGFRFIPATTQSNTK